MEDRYAYERAIKDLVDSARRIIDLQTALGKRLEGPQPSIHSHSWVRAICFRFTAERGGRLRA